MSGCQTSSISLRAFLRSLPIIRLMTAGLILWSAHMALARPVTTMMALFT